MKILGVKEFQAGLTQRLRSMREGGPGCAISYHGKVFAKLVRVKPEKSEKLDPRSVLVQKG